MLIKSADRAVNICEMKYSDGEYELKADECVNLKHRREAYIEDEKFKGSVFLTLVTPHGALHNAHWNDIQSEVTLDDLFAAK